MEQNTKGTEQQDSNGDPNPSNFQFLEEINKMEQKMEQKMAN
jgi:hypothetical protein